jgi:hypothetical protein
MTASVSVRNAKPVPAAGLAVEAEEPRVNTDDHVGAEPAIERGASGVAEAAATTTAAGCPAELQVEARRVGALVQIDELRQGHEPLTERDRLRGVRAADAVPRDREGGLLKLALGDERVEEAGLGQLPVLRKIDRFSATPRNVPRPSTRRATAERQMRNAREAVRFCAGARVVGVTFSTSSTARQVAPNAIELYPILDFACFTS